MSWLGRVPLGSVAEFINGVAFKPADWSEEGHCIIRIQNLTDGSKPYNRTTRIVNEKYHVRPGDLLVSWSATLGVFVWDGPEVGLVNQHIFRVVPKPERVHVGYLRQMLIDALIEMERHLHGATMKHINRKEFLSTKIPLPPLAEQKRVAGILDAADALRAKRREALAQIDTFLQSTFLDMFGDPVKNPMGWDDALRLGDLAEIVSGITKGRKVNGASLREVPYLAVSNVQDRSLRLDVVKTIAATEAEIARYSLRPGDLLLTEGGDPDKLGRGTLWNGEIAACIHQNHVFRVRSQGSMVDPMFLNWIVGSRRGKSYFLRSAKQTTGIASINMKQLKAFPLLVPPLDLQRRFAAIVESVERQKDRMRAHLAELDALFTSLQSRAFKGAL
jgi:type I restriction enzyme, S subunit